METQRDKNGVIHMIKPGDTCYIIENNIRVSPAVLKNVRGNFYTLALESGSVIRLQHHRVYETYEEAVAGIKQTKKNKNPYDYMR